jgi:hypothetical protein
VKPYDTFDAIAPFAAATGAFDRLEGALAGSAESAALSHHELEELIGLESREVRRLLFQGHLDLREKRGRTQMRQTQVRVIRRADGHIRTHHEVDGVPPGGVSREHLRNGSGIG